MVVRNTSIHKVAFYPLKGQLGKIIVHCTAKCLGVRCSHLQPVGHDNDRGISDGTEQLFGCPLLFFPVVLLLHLHRAKTDRQKIFRTSISTTVHINILHSFSH